jgi:nucleotide-binding universal stress UspA family protein
VVVGYDGSEGAQAALEYASARRPRQKLIVVRVYPPSSAIPDDSQPSGEEGVQRQALIAELASWNDHRSDAIDYAVEEVRGSPIAALLDVARRCDADEIVVGAPSHRESHPSSISQQLLGIADRPVVIVPASYPEQHRDISGRLHFRDPEQAQTPPVRHVSSF